MNQKETLHNRKPIYLAVILISAIAILVIFQVFRSDESERPESHNLSDEEYEKGKQLSQTYCTRCHSYPDPGLLPKETWKSETLPAMGPLLGISSHNGSQYSRLRTNWEDSPQFLLLENKMSE